MSSPFPFPCPVGLHRQRRTSTATRPRRWRQPSLSSLLAPSPASPAESEHAHRTTVHEEFTGYGFPVGLYLLASGVALSMAHIALYFGDLCEVTLLPDSYLTTFSRIVRGKFVENRIAELDGVRVLAFFKWCSCKGIRSSGDDLVLEVWMVNAEYPSTNFDEAPACEGRGIDP